MLAALKAVKGVQNVVCLGKKEQGSYDFEIVPEDGADVRAGISNRIAERKKTLLSLTSSRLTLEQIFLKLTQAPNNDAARKMLGLDEESAAKPTAALEDDAASIVIEMVDEIETKEDEE